jgi:hypothetical protein
MNKKISMASSSYIAPVNICSSGTNSRKLITFWSRFWTRLMRKVDGRLINWFLRGPFADGGQWDMVTALVE